jgi:hypothetical protein
MKRIIILLSILFSAVAVHAQTTETAEQRAHNQALHLQKLVSTNEDQTQKAEAIFLAKILAIDAILKDSSKSKEQQQADIAQVRAEKDKELQAVLTADQYTTYKNKMDEIAARKNGTLTH